MNDMKVGRPLKWKTLDELQPIIDSYFNDTPKEEWTITGLALALDTSRQTLLEYEGEKEGKDRPKEFIDAIKKAKLKVEHSYEIDLKKSGRTGTIFALKNFDWKDKTEQDLTTGGDKLVFLPSEVINKLNGTTPETKGNSELES